MTIHWLDEQSFAKALGQWRLQAGEIISTFKSHALEEPHKGEYTLGALRELEEITIDFSKRVRGEKDQPIRVKVRRNPR